MNVWKPKSKMGQPKKVCNDTAKKNVGKPKSKMGQPNKVCNEDFIRVAHKDRILV